MSENATTQIRKYPYSTLIWAVIGRNYKSKLIFVEKSVNEQRYKRLLMDSKIFSELNKKEKRFSFLFQQDGATCHWTSLVMKYICRYARVLNGWPPNPPDISPIENLWAIMKERLNRLTTKPKSKSELKQLIQHVYDSIDLETINNLINTFEYRIQMVKDFGRKTKRTEKKFYLQDTDDGMISHSPNGWMTAELMKTYLDWLARTMGPQKIAVILDVYKAHVNEEVRNNADSKNIELTYVPALGYPHLRNCKRKINRQNQYQYNNIRYIKL